MFDMGTAASCQKGCLDNAMVAGIGLGISINAPGDDAVTALLLLPLQ